MKWEKKKKRGEVKKTKQKKGDKLLQIFPGSSQTLEGMC